MVKPQELKLKNNNVKKITILTLFPTIFENFVKFSIIKRAIYKKKINIKVINFREYSTNKHNKVDDYQCGGGGGMVIALPAIVKAIKKNSNKNTYIILLTPQGKTYNQQKAKQLCKLKKNLLIICGHYEGFDARINKYVDEKISIGDYILTGGEIPAMVLVDSITRLIKNVITPSSLKNESFTNNLLDYDCFTKPLEYDGLKVPDVLLSGNHKKIENFRKQNQINKTKKYRPDLINKKK